MYNYFLDISDICFKRLDEHALIASQDYNYSNESDWFGTFRGGLYGMYSRLFAVQRHYYDVHAWTIHPRVLADAEYHLSVIFFGMDSAIECLTYALNALGNAIEPSVFHDVTDEKALKKYRPITFLAGENLSRFLGTRSISPPCNLIGLVKGN